MYHFKHDSKDLVIQMLDTTKGLLSGISTLDNYTLGFFPGEYIIVAGRPSMGKSSFARDICLAIGKTNSVVLFSLEMIYQEIAELCLANLAKVDYYSIKRGHITDAIKSRLDKALQDLSTYTIIIDDNSHCTPMNIRKALGDLNKEEQIDCVIVDYLQLMSIGKRVDRQEEVSEISRELKAIAKEFNVPVIALSQLNRQVEYRESTRPRMSDLRESGALENDADKVLLLHRPSYYDIKLDCNAEDSGEAEIIIAKNRKGKVGVINCAWCSEFMSWMDVPEEF